MVVSNVRWYIISLAINGLSALNDFAWKENVPISLFYGILFSAYEYDIW